MSVITWKESSGFVGELESEDVNEAIEIGKLIYEADDDIESVSVTDNGKVVREWVW